MQAAGQQKKVQGFTGVEVGVLQHLVSAKLSKECLDQTNFSIVALLFYSVSDFFEHHNAETVRDRNRVIEDTEGGNILCILFSCSRSGGGLIYSSLPGERAR